MHDKASVRSLCDSGGVKQRLTVRYYDRALRAFRAERNCYCDSCARGGTPIRNANVRTRESTALRWRYNGKSPPNEMTLTVLNTSSGFPSVVKPSKVRICRWKNVHALGRPYRLCGGRLGVTWKYNSYFVYGLLYGSKFKCIFYHLRSRA